MPDWTQPAREEVSRYFARVRASLAETDADADEVIGDLDRHIAEEIAAAGLTVVTEEDARRILARIGPPDSQPAAESRRPTPVADTGPRPTPKPWHVWSLVFGVVLPVITLAFEYFTGMCAALLFDPLPSVWHVLLVATVPLANFLVWRAVRSEGIEQPARLGWRDRERGRGGAGFHGPKSKGEYPSAWTRLHSCRLSGPAEAPPNV